MRKNSIKKIVYGDVFCIGDHVIACGDARDTEFVNRVIGKRKITMVCVDPPYGVSLVEAKAGFAKLKMPKVILNDDIASEPEYARFTKEWLIPIIPHLEKKNSFYVFNSDKMLFALRDGMRQAGVRFSQLLIWIKNHAVVGRKDYLPAHELIAFGWHGTHKFRKSKDKTLFYYPKPNKSPYHPSTKPVGLIRRLVLNSSDIGDVVYDCFLGSGTTMLACEQAKRVCIGIERDPDYILTAIQRVEAAMNFTAQKI
jgi:DNA modification methylase